MFCGDYRWGLADSQGLQAGMDRTKLCRTRWPWVKPMRSTKDSNVPRSVARWMPGAASTLTGWPFTACSRRLRTRAVVVGQPGSEERPVPEVGYGRDISM